LIGSMEVFGEDHPTMARTMELRGEQGGSIGSIG